MSESSFRGVSRVPEFRALFVAEILSILALVAVQITLSVLIFDRTGSPLLSSLAFALGFLPHLLGASLLSSAADRFPARTVMVVTQLVSGVVMACMAIPGTPVPVMLMLLVVSGTVAPVYSGARSTALADVLTPEGFPLGRSLLRIAAQTAQIGGFSFGGALMLAAAPPVALSIAAALMVFSALVVGLGTVGRPGREVSGGLVASSLSGTFRALRAPGLRAVLLLSWVPAALFVWPEALAAPLASSMGGGPMLVALLLTAGPVGTVVGEVAAGALLNAEGRRRWMLPLAFVAFLPMTLFVLEPGPAVAVAVLALGALGWGYTLALDALLLAEAPEETRGRVFSLGSAGLMISQGAGFALAGAMAEFLPAHLVVALAGVGGVVSVVVFGRRFAGRRRVRTAT
ncbi:MFS transporter [Nocardiopsis alba]|uniref:MFS transporter n=1 Tax=Nocardiopsis alba TaxID=53437 RepID=UPI0035D8BADA